MGYLFTVSRSVAMLYHQLAAWCVSADRHISEVIARRARLVLGWVTVFGRV